VLLKGIRNTVAVSLTGAMLVSPRAGLFASLTVIAVTTWLFSRALRLSVVGSCFAWDLLRRMVFGSRAKPVKGDSVAGFSAGNVDVLLEHTLGRLRCGDNGNLEFRYRILFLGPLRTVQLDNAANYQVGRGLLYPSLVLPHRGQSVLQFRLLPRYKGLEEEVCASLGAGAVQDLLFHKNWRRFWNWAEGETGAPQISPHLIAKLASAPYFLIFPSWIKQPATAGTISTRSRSKMFRAGLFAWPKTLASRRPAAVKSFQA